MFPPKLSKYHRQGSYGKVYISVVNGKQLAVKKVAKEESQEEISILLDLQVHPSVCLLIDHFSTQKYNYIYMPYYPKSLYDKISGEIILPDQRVLYLTQLLQGLEFIKSKSIIHRDLTPNNIMLSPSIKICDFGGSCRHDNEPKSTDVCTINYRAWELLHGSQQYDYSVDMWSLGCIFAEMGTQAVLYDGDDTQDIIEAVESVSVESMLDFLPAQEMHVLEQMLVRDPKQRIDPTAALKLLTV